MAPPQKPKPKSQPKKTGRPSAFKPEYAEQARKLCLLGATDVELADFFGVTDRTIDRWQTEYPEFCDALKVGKELADDRVERSLYRRATGYSVEAVRIFMPAKAEQPVYAPFREHVGPDTTACIFWLKNRRPEQWRDKSDIDVTHATYAIGDEPPTEDEWRKRHVTSH